MIHNERCWAVIDLDAIYQNAIILKKRLPDSCAFMAVVKGDAYGHGMVPVARTCAEAGVSWFGTATIDEAIELRRQEINQPILIFGITPPERAAELVRHGLSQIVPSLGYARALHQNLRHESQPLSIHIGVDTGMGRLGWWTQAETISMVSGEILQIARLPSLQIEGVMTQLSSGRSNTPEAVAYTKDQLWHFDQLCCELQRYGIHPVCRHVLNSGGFINHSGAAMDMVRIGHLLFEPLPGAERFGLRPAIEIKTTIAYVKELPAGAFVGYGRTYQLSQSARIAVLNIGHCDGYPACLSNKGQLLLHGVPVPVVGSVCMDQTMVDISAVPSAKAGDVVTIVGQDGDMVQTMEDVSRQADGLLDDPLSVNLTNRITRYYKRNNRLIGRMNIQSNFVDFSAKRKKGAI